MSPIQNPNDGKRISRRVAMQRGLAGAGGLLFLVWLAWFFWSSVPVYEVSKVARLEAEREVHQVQASVGGRIVSAHLKVGDSVKAGEILVELDAVSLIDTSEERTLADVR